MIAWTDPETGEEYRAFSARENALLDALVAVQAKNAALRTALGRVAGCGTDHKLARTIAVAALRSVPSSLDERDAASRAGDER